MTTAEAARKKGNNRHAKAIYDQILEIVPDYKPALESLGILVWCLWRLLSLCIRSTEGGDLLQETSSFPSRSTIWRWSITFDLSTQSLPMQSLSWSMCLCVYRSLLIPIYLSIYPSVHPAIQPSIHLIYLSPSVINQSESSNLTSFIWQNYRLGEAYFKKGSYNESIEIYKLLLNQFSNLGGMHMSSP